MKPQMKITTFLILTAFSLSSFAQEVKWGVKAGANLLALSNVEFCHKGYPSYVTIKRNGMAAGYHVGLFRNVTLGKHLHFQPEILFSMQGGKQQGYDYPNGGKGSGLLAGPNLIYRLGYIQVPLLFEIKPVANWGILVGAQASLNVSRKYLYSYSGWKESVSGKEFNNSIYGNGFKRLDAGLVLGVQYTLTKKITVNARYHCGLFNNMNYTTAYDENQSYKGMKSHVIQVGVGFVLRKIANQ